MEKSIKINIAGIIFQISEDGYEILRDYLQEITKRLINTTGGSEMIDDIESRIAEIFQSKPSWQTAVISREEVEEMISIMGDPEDIAGALESEPYENYSGRRQRNLYRNSDNRIIGGVCSGIGEYTGIDPVWIRILFVLFTLVYLSGAIVYIVLWIALPLVGGEAYRKMKVRKEPAGKGYIKKEHSASSSSAVGNAFNEVFRAFGKFFVILFRIILAIIGVAFIIAGFSALFSFLFISFFHSNFLVPGFFETSVFYLPSFLSFLVDPSLAVWLVILTTIAIILPLLALIYWGIRMVFQFRVRDLTLNLTMLIIWILSCTALSIILFAEGVSFSESSRSSEHVLIPKTDTIYFDFDKRISSLNYEKNISLPFEGLALYLDEDEKAIFGRPEINIYNTDEEPYINIVKYSNGINHSDAVRKSRKLEYNLSITDSLVKLDEYFSIPPGNRWSGAFVKIRVYIPDGYTIYFDEELEDIMLDDYFGCGIQAWEAGGKFWKMTEGRLEDTD